MQIVNLAMRIALGMIQLAAFESGGIAGIGKTLLHFRSRQAGELRQELGAALPDLPIQFGVVIGEKKKRAGRARIPALEKASACRAPAASAR